MKPRYLVLKEATAERRDSIVRRMENPAHSGIRRLREQCGVILGLLILSLIAIAAPASAQYIQQPAPPSYFVLNLGHDNFLVRPQRWAGPNGPVYDPRESPINPFSYQRQYNNSLPPGQCNIYAYPGSYGACP